MPPAHEGQPADHPHFAAHRAIPLFFFVPLHPNHPSMTATFHTTNFDCEVPLSFDTLFYVESIENKQLNQLIQELSADVQNQSRRLKTTPHPFPLHLRYVSQKEVRAGNLASQLQELGYPEDEVPEYVSLLQTGLSTEKGGYLAMMIAVPSGTTPPSSPPICSSATPPMPSGTRCRSLPMRPPAKISCTSQE